MKFAIAQIISLLIPFFVAGTCVLSAASWWSISKWRLPIPQVLAFIATILPFVNFVCNKFLVTLIYQDQRHRQPVGKLALTALAAILLYSLDVAILTLSATYLTKPTQGCLLKNRWEFFWRHKSKDIRELQDAFDCCGFGYLTEMPYPFPSGNPQKGGSDLTTCRENTHRTAFCRPAWEAKMNTNAGMLVGATSIVVFVNLVTLLVVMSRSPRVNRLLFFPFSGPHDYRIFMREDDDPNGAYPERGRIEPYHDEEDQDEEQQRQHQQLEQHGRNPSPPGDAGANPWRAITSNTDDSPEQAEQQHLLDRVTSAPEHLH